MVPPRSQPHSFHALICYQVIHERYAGNLQDKNQIYVIRFPFYIDRGKAVEFLLIKFLFQMVHDKLAGPAIALAIFQVFIDKTPAWG